MAESDDEGWYRRKIGKKIELGANRVLGWFLLGVAVFAVLLTLSSDNFDFTTHWPGLVAAAVMLFLSRLCFRAKEGIIQGFGDEADYVPPRRKPD